MNTLNPSTQKQDDSQRSQLVSLLTDMFREALEMQNDGQATTEERLQADSATRFSDFDSAVDVLADVLFRLASDAHRLGSSVRVVLAAKRMRLRLLHLKAELSSQVRSLIFLETSRQDTTSPQRSETLPQAFRDLSEDVEQLTSCLHEFPKFADVSDSRALRTLQNDLLLCDGITVPEGIPALLAKQEHEVENKLNLIQIATFFSGITATAISFSAQGMDKDTISVAVNGFWFTSLYVHPAVIVTTAVLTIIMLIGFLAGYAWLCFGSTNSDASSISSGASMSLEKLQPFQRQDGGGFKFQLARQLLGLPVARLPTMELLLAITVSAGVQRRMSVRMFTQRLTKIDMKRELNDHTNLVNHLQFSPDGSRLVTTSRDQRSLLYRFDQKRMPVLWRTMVHVDGEARQLDWSPNGQFLLARLANIIQVWSKDGVLLRGHRGLNSRSAVWIPTTDSTPGDLRAGCFLSAEEGKIICMHKDAGFRAEYVADYPSGKLDIQDIEITNDGRRFIAIGSLDRKSNQPVPQRCAIERQIIVYDMDAQIVERCIPVSRDVHDVTLAQNGVHALVSYRLKTPPQLWKFELPKGNRPLSLTLEQTYLAEEDAVSFAGSSYFGGENDQLVLCAGKAGGVYIWHTHTGKLLRHITAKEGMGADLSCVAGSRQENPFIVATGSINGAVQIWAKDIRDVVDMGKKNVAKQEKREE
ncbi:WD40-repeat-containing domain protein [Vararia minispora EC-137]|uniref:WD40-repeat-containing domain protein n=1 Tax=Vararia minispora EC-137 TaxID=1314806 RepID=A0ACB8QFD5_9AGAM|nr:WD40-repeat-containing domain protein [Vararia minispora EC-137]